MPELTYAERTAVAQTDGLNFTLHETGGAHAIDPTAKGKAIQWLGRAVRC